MHSSNCFDLHCSQHGLCRVSLRPPTRCFSCAAVCRIGNVLTSVLHRVPAGCHRSMQPAVGLTANSLKCKSSGLQHGKHGTGELQVHAAVCYCAASTTVCQAALAVSVQVITWQWDHAFAWHAVLH